MPLKEANPRSINAQFSTVSVENDQSAHYLIFYEDWCPDCKAIEGLIHHVFDKGGAPLAQIVRVGSISDWKSSSNVYRKEFNLKSIPTIIRYEKNKEIGRLDDINAETLVRFIAY